MRPGPVPKLPAGWRQRCGPRRELRDFIPSKQSTADPGSARDPLVRTIALARLEAALFASHEPISPRQLVKLADLADTGEVRRQVQELNRILDRDRSAFAVQELAGGYQLLTRPELRTWLDPIYRNQTDVTLSGPMLETLAIIAYRQPIGRADVEAIRGVQVGEIIRHLLELGLVRMVGKEETLGRPFLYGTSPKFLEFFGLRNLSELPMAEVLARPEHENGTAEDPPSDPPAEADSTDEVTEVD